MNNAMEYLIAAISYRYLYVGQDFTFPIDMRELKVDINQYYDIDIPEDKLLIAVQSMADLGIIGYTDDRYAGIILSFDAVQLNTIYTKYSDEKKGMFKDLDDSPHLFYLRALQNKQFWIDINDEPYQLLSTGDETVPASDRVVTVLHNSSDGQVISTSIEQIISDLDVNNQIANEAGDDRDRLLAEGRASLALVRGERIRQSALVQIVWRFLKEIAVKFKEKISEWGVDKAIEKIEDILGMIK